MPGNSPFHPRRNDIISIVEGLRVEKLRVEKLRVEKLRVEKLRG
jgi:hypothetical protein